MTFSELAVEYIDCHYCGAQRGEMCVIARGRTVGARASYIHGDRSRAAQKIWAHGYADGIEEGRYLERSGQ